MREKQRWFAFLLAGMLGVSTLGVWAQETTAVQDAQETVTEKEPKKEAARKYLEENGVWILSENMKCSITLPDQSWKQSEEGAAGYEGNFVSGESVMEVQILGENTPHVQEQELPKDKEEFQSMMTEDVEVLEFEVESTPEETVIKTILKFARSKEEGIYTYAVACQTYQAEKGMEVIAYTDDESILYILMESVSSAELL